VAERLVKEQSPAEFFKEQVERALEHQKVSTSAFTEYYLVNLLTGCIHSDALPAPDPGYDEMPLALIYLRALQADRFERMRLLRAMGDTALFTVGFFADSLAGKLSELAYYRALGGRAYASLSQEDAPNALGASVFSELAGRFGQFADVLSEVSESTRLATHKSILDLYERWLQTGSRRAALLLAERGIAPVLPGESRPQ
jgi:hypothetical protein